VHFTHSRVARTLPKTAIAAFQKKNISFENPFDCCGRWLGGRWLWLPGRCCGRWFRWQWIEVDEGFRVRASVP